MIRSAWITTEQTNPFQLRLLREVSSMWTWYWTKELDLRFWKILNPDLTIYRHLIRSQFFLRGWFFCLNESSSANLIFVWIEFQLRIFIDEKNWFDDSFFETRYHKFRNGFGSLTWKPAYRKVHQWSIVGFIAHIQRHITNTFSFQHLP